MTSGEGREGATRRGDEEGDLSRWNQMKREVFKTGPENQQKIALSVAEVSNNAAIGRQNERKIKKMRKGGTVVTAISMKREKNPPSPKA